MTDQTGESAWTLLRLINWTKDRFAQQEVQSPRLAAEVLLAHVLQCPRMSLYTQFDRVATDAERGAYRELIKRASDHEPVAYLVGHKEFYSLEMTVTHDVLIPRPETELLVDRAVEHLRNLGRAGSCWDICTGSGAVAVAVACNAPQATVLATDISPAAVAVTEINAAAHDVADRLTASVADLLALPDATAGAGPFDVITANPPYITERDMAELPPDVRHEPREALYGGVDGLEFVTRILADAPARLATGGLVAIEIGYNQAEAVWDRVTGIDAYERGQFARDAAGIERVLVAYRK